MKLVDETFKLLGHAILWVNRLIRYLPYGIYEAISILVTNLNFLNVLFLEYGATTL